MASTPFMARQFPTEVRSSGVGSGREISGALAGGFAPLAALAMVTMSPTHSTWGVSLLIAASGFLIVLGVLFDQRRRVDSRSRSNPSGSEGARSGMDAAPSQGTS
ncbi:hypothetical protein ACWEN3_37440 [Streptomyces sp. NPDC004561]